MIYEVETDIMNSAKGLYNATEDIVAAVEKTAKRFNITNKQVVKLLPLDLYVKFLIVSKAIPDIDANNYLETKFSSDWLDACGNID